MIKSARANPERIWVLILFFGKKQSCFLLFVGHGSTRRAHRAPKNPCNTGFQQSDALLSTAHAVHFQLASQAENRKPKLWRRFFAGILCVLQEKGTKSERKGSGMRRRRSDRSFPHKKRSSPWLWHVRFFTQSRATSQCSWYLASWLPLFLQIFRRCVVFGTRNRHLLVGSLPRPQKWGMLLAVVPAGASPAASSGSRSSDLSYM